MKKIFLIVVFTFITLSQVFSQDFEPAQAKFRWFDGRDVFISADSAYFKQRSFMLGWHWGGPKKISQAMKVQQRDADRNTDVSQIVDNCDVLLKPQESSHATDGSVLNARGFQYEPTLKLDPLNPDKFVTRLGDTTCPVFGFTNVRGFISNNINDINYNRLVISGDSLDNHVILSNTWPRNFLYMHGIGNNDDATSSGKNVINKYLCRQLLISINLRKLNNDSGNIPILKVELPYKIINNSSEHLIQFTTIPSTNGGNYQPLANGRGLIQIQDTCNTVTTFFYITKDMLPNNNQDITLSAFFKLDNAYSIKNYNPLMKSNLIPQKDEIDSIDIKITYLGGAPVAIDWVRLETPHCKDLLSGEYDEQIVHNFQNDLDKYTTQELRDRNVRLLRSNLIIEGYPFNWIAEHYYSKLIGNIVTDEVKILYPSHYEHYVNSPDRWFGVHKNMAWVSVPFTKFTYDNSNSNNAKTMGMINGYMGLHLQSGTNQISLDSTASHYETYLKHKKDLWPITVFIDSVFDLAEYEQTLNTDNNGWKASPLVHWERTIYDSYFNKVSNGFLYSPKNWWAQNFIHQTFQKKDWFVPPLRNPLDTTVYTFEYNRPITGEEFRLSAALPIMLGAKGVIYDGPFTMAGDQIKTYMYDGEWIEQSVRDSIESLPDFEFLNSEIAGSDFFKQQNELFNAENKFYYLDSVSKYQSRPIEKIYMGRKSVRLEMYKLHTWIRAVESDLMNLKLMSYSAKGFKEWYSQDTSFQANIMSQYIVKDSIRTRCIGFNSDEGTAKYHYKDSSFYDISLLRNMKSDSVAGDQFYIGVSNRRTSPLIREPNGALYFYSTAEFDKFIIDGGVRLSDNTFQPASWWRSKWWTRMGCREIRIPINYQPNGKTDALFKVAELGADSLKEMPWRDPTVYYTVDTLLRSVDTLIVRLLPGETKILSFQRFQENIQGKLEYSNQHKLISYPVNGLSDSVENSIVRYHLVYFKEIKDDPKRMGIFYKRSNITNSSTPNFAIDWESKEHLISSEEAEIKNRFDSTFYNDKGFTYLHPSMVIRPDTSGNDKVYVVYEGYKIDHPDTLFVFETTFNANKDNAAEKMTLSYEIGRIASERYNAENLVENEYCAPDINSSSFGNYYTWANPDSGIFVGWKGSDVKYFASYSDVMFLKAASVPNDPHENIYYSKHPSFNNYSRLKPGEDDCAIVWQEIVNPSVLNRIFYTRLYHNTYTISNSIPVYYQDPNLGIIDRINNNIAMLSNFDVAENQNTMPFIHRGVESYSSPANISVSVVLNHFDRVYWQSSLGVPSHDTSFIAMRAIDIFDEINNGQIVPNSWNTYFTMRIIHRFENLGQANACQGLMKGDRDFFRNPIIADSIIVLNFVSYPYIGDNYEPISDQCKIWNLPHGYWTFFHPVPQPPIVSYPDVSVEDYPYAKIVTQKGMQSHLSSTPFVLGESDWNLNRRVFNTDSPEKNSIVSSVFGFYKNIDNSDDGEIGFFGYADTNGRRAMMSKIIYYDNQHTKGLDMQQLFENRADSLVSDWFSIGQGELKYLSQDFDPSIIEMYLQRQSDNKIFRLNAPKLNKKLNVLKNRLINGKNNQYRLIVKKSGQKIYYTEDLMLGNISDVVTEYSGNSLTKSGIDEFVDVTNLGEENNTTEIFANPNPANDYVEISVPNEINGTAVLNKTIKIYSAEGSLMFESGANKTSSIIVNTKNFAVGSYYIVLESLLDTYQVSKSSKAFIISR